jgi:hypothetical protein
MKSKQTKQVLDYLVYHGSITAKQATDDLGIMRLAARVLDLKKEGYNIITNIEQGWNRTGERTHYAKYELKNTELQVWDKVPVFVTKEQLSLSL